MSFPVLLAVLLLVSCSSALLSLPPSPCPEIYSYEQDPISNEWNGLISILTPARYIEAETQVVFNSSEVVAPEDRLQMFVRGGYNATMEARKSAMESRRHVLQYTIKFPSNKPVPTLLKIIVNNRLFCGDDDVPADSGIQTVLNAVLSTGLESPRSDGQDFGVVNLMPELQPLQVPVAGCWPKYELLPGVGCYKDVKEKMTWEQARLSCAADGAQLAVPESRQEIDFFNQIRKRAFYAPWMGIHKVDGEWRSVQGFVFPDNSSFWERGEPIDGYGECIGVYSEGLYNTECAGTLPSICRQP